MVGSLVHFRGPRVGFLRRQLELGLVLGVDEPSEVVHVSLLWDPPQSDCLEVEIGLLPLHLAAYQRSFVKHLGHKETGDFWWPAMSAWRELHQHGLTGGFILPLEEARQAAWQTVQEQQPDATREGWFLEYAFPVATAPGARMDRVRVEVTQRRAVI